MEERCLAHIDITPRSATRKCCVECPGCGADIKRGSFSEHERSCVALREYDEFMASLTPGDEYVTRDDSLSVIQGAARCVYCGKLVRARTEEWHWRHSCETSPINRTAAGR